MATIARPMALHPKQAAAKQSLALAAAFRVTQHPSALMIDKLARRNRLSTVQVVDWFIRRRQWEEWASRHPTEQLAQALVKGLHSQSQSPTSGRSSAAQNSSECDE